MRAHFWHLKGDFIIIFFYFIFYFIFLAKTSDSSGQMRLRACERAE